VCNYRLILNGTPISKNEADLFAQWYILDKRILGYNSFWSFAANHLEYDEYGRPVRCLNIDYLTRKIAPYSYTITKKECLNLPAKRYYTKYFSLTDLQNYHYEESKFELLDNINEFDSTTIYRLFTGLQQIVSGRLLTKLLPLRSVAMFDNPLDNPRIKALLKVIPDDKVIIWCKFKHEIQDVEEVLRDKYGSSSVSLFYGDINQKRRIMELDRFRKTAQFLIAHKVCGGYGLNLQFCNETIYYSNDFNWATRAQSEDRTHRIGQQREVSITDLCATSKVDERILKNLWGKENLSDNFKKELKSKRDMSSWIDGKD
jgi:SNF2 family DNA or RNA helicase